MDWLSTLFSGPGAGALAVPVVLAGYWALNAGKKEQNRKGLHPLTKACLWAMAAFIALVCLIQGAKFIGWL